MNNNKIILYTLLSTIFITVGLWVVGLTDEELPIKGSNLVVSAAGQKESSSSSGVQKSTQEPEAEDFKPSPEEFKKYVNEKFGDDAWRAFAILHGTKYCGGENGKHNPNAMNENKDENGNVTSRDWGYWQFNDKFHPEVTRECAKDIKCSTDRAYEMFVHDKGFKQWSAGKCIGL